MNIEKLSASTPIADFEYFIRQEVPNLEKYAAQMRSMRGKIVDAGAYGRNSITDSDILMGFYFHLESMKAMVDQMTDAEEIIRDMEDDEVEQAYARGELAALKKSFAMMAKQVYLSVEKWVNYEANSGRYGRPELAREIFYSVTSSSRVAPSVHPMMYNPFPKISFDKI